MLENISHLLISIFFVIQINDVWKGVYGKMSEKNTAEKDPYSRSLGIDQRVMLAIGILNDTIKIQEKNMKLASKRDDDAAFTKACEMEDLCQNVKKMLTGDYYIGERPSDGHVVPRTSNRRKPGYIMYPTYRAWSIADNNWVYGAYFDQGVRDTRTDEYLMVDYEPKIVCNKYDEANRTVTAVAKTVDYASVNRNTGRFIGGKYLFEGDIILSKFESSAMNKADIGVIKYGIFKQQYQENLGFYIYWVDQKCREEMKSGLIRMIDVWNSSGWSVEVIGNVYRNPELVQEVTDL